MKARRLGGLLLVPMLAFTACNDTDSDPAIDVDVSRADKALFSAADQASFEVAAELGIQYLHENAAEHLAGVDEIWTKRVQIDELGMAHTRIMQTVNTIPVWGGEAIVHMSPSGEVVGVTNDLITNVVVDTQPKLDMARAVDLALLDFGNPARLTQEPEAELLVVRHEGIDYLTWQVRLAQLDGSEQSSMPVYFIDAHTGDIVTRYDDLKTTSLSDGDKRTYDMRNGTSYSGAVIGDSSDEVANDAHVHAGYTLDYFQTVHGRDSFDGNGALVRSYVHYSRNYVNAFWNGSVLTYGDGDNVVSGPLVTLDVVAHEFAHGVTDFSADLIYQNESGALNEATSDILAAGVEAFIKGSSAAPGVYEVGEDCWLAAPALRFMYDPTLDGKSRDHYTTRYTGFEDNGGVHMNSGIANLFFYLLAEGGQHPKPEHRVATVTAIGIDSAAAIWYRALTQYMTASTKFAGARTATLNAATDLFGAGSDELCEVQNAWAEVGVGSACSGEPPPPPPGDSCEGRCGNFDSSKSCQCDDACVQYGDCCDDYDQECNSEPDPNSCVQNNACGGQAPGGCYCDNLCVQFGDCCPDGPC